MARQFSRWFLVGLLAVGVGVGGCKKGEPPKSENTEQNADQKEEPKNENIKKEKVFLSPVLVKVVERGEIKASVAATGSIVPARSQAIRTEEAGRLRFEREWREGDVIKQGDVIARIESASLISELAINRADVDIQKETMDIGERTLAARLRDYETLQDLHAQGIAAEKEVDAAKLELDRARNSQRQNAINLAKAETRLTETELRMERTTLRAPFDGIVVSRATLEGQGKFTRGFGSEAITDYDTQQVAASFVVCGVVDTTKVFMRCDITSKGIAKVHLGGEADIVVYANEDVEAQGQVARIASNVNPDTRAFDVDILLQNGDGRLKPGMFGKAEVITERRRDTIALPKAGVTRRQNMDVVFLAEKMVDTDYHVARMVPIELGLESKDAIEVLSGVKTGDQVIIRGMEVLQDATPIRPIDVDASIRPDEENVEDSGS